MPRSEQGFAHTNSTHSSSSIEIPSSFEANMMRVCKVIDLATLESNYSIKYSCMILPPLHILEPLRGHMQLIYDFGFWDTSDKNISVKRITGSLSQASHRQPSSEKGTTEQDLMKISKEWCSGGSLCDLIRLTLSDCLEVMDMRF